MQSIITVIGQSDLGASEIVPAILVFVGLITVLIFLGLVVGAMVRKSHQIAALACCLSLGVGFVVRPWTYFFESAPDSAFTLSMKIQLAAWLLSLLISVAVFLYCYVTWKRQQRRPRKRKRVTRATER